MSRVQSSRPPRKLPGVRKLHEKRHVVDVFFTVVDASSAIQTRGIVLIPPFQIAFPLERSPMIIDLQ